MRIAIGGFQHETNTFAPSRATYERFVQGGGWPPVSIGDEIFERFRRNAHRLIGQQIHASAHICALHPRVRGRKLARVTICGQRNDVLPFRQSLVPAAQMIGDELRRFVAPGDEQESTKKARENVFHEKTRFKGRVRPRAVHEASKARLSGPHQEQARLRYVILAVRVARWSGLHREQVRLRRVIPGAPGVLSDRFRANRGDRPARCS